MVVKPVIGLFSKIDNEEYKSVLLPENAEAIEVAGGLPILLPMVEDDSTIDSFIELCDGFFFTGGFDISPERYGEQIKPTCGEIELKRDELEFRALDKIIKTGKPILGVCRGMQLINAYLGGTLYQDIPTERPSEINHRQPREDRYVITHDILVEDNTPLKEIVKVDRIKGNTFHHQCIKTLGEGLKLSATADDGIVEGYFHATHPYLVGYQWHPERLVKLDDNNLKIFKSFISACKKK